MRIFMQQSLNNFTALVRKQILLEKKLHIHFTADFFSSSKPDSPIQCQPTLDVNVEKQKINL